MALYNFVGLETPRRFLLSNFPPECSFFSEKFSLHSPWTYFTVNSSKFKMEVQRLRILSRASFHLLSHIFNPAATAQIFWALFCNNAVLKSREFTCTHWIQFCCQLCKIFVCSSTHGKKINPLSHFLIYSQYLHAWMMIMSSAQVCLSLQTLRQRS